MINMGSYCLFVCLTLFLSSCEKAYANVSSVFSENTWKKVSTSCQNNLLGTACSDWGNFVYPHFLLNV